MAADMSRYRCRCPVERYSKPMFPSQHVVSVSCAIQGALFTCYTQAHSRTCPPCNVLFECNSFDGTLSTDFPMHQALLLPVVLFSPPPLAAPALPTPRQTAGGSAISPHISAGSVMNSHVLWDRRVGKMPDVNGSSMKPMAS